MIGALWTGISGLDAHQAALDNESNNIANVNTIGYKASRISFADQIYQDNIGKGALIQHAEKTFQQGNIKLTGVSYDVALNGDGFITVSDTNRGGGSAETFYTRAGNLRMGPDGTLQDANGNVVQGWVMTSIDQKADVLTTNPNIFRFTDAYTKIVSSEVIKHGDSIETISAKTTDFNKTVKSDSKLIFSGAGFKTESGKVADIEELAKAYDAALKDYKKDPDGLSATATTQISYVQFPNLASDAINSEEDVITININGKQITQQFDTDYATTMKNFADKISATPGIKAYTVVPIAGTNPVAYRESTDPADIARGVLKIEGLVPGQASTISTAVAEAGSMIGGNLLPGRDAVQGSGLARVESIRDKLSEAVSGKQQDVYLPSDLFFVNPDNGQITTPYAFDFQLSIWDKDTETNILVPSAGAKKVTIAAGTTDPVAALQQITTQLMWDTPPNPGATPPVVGVPSSLSKQIDVTVMNGALVVETRDSNFDVEFNGSFNRVTTPGTTVATGNLKKNEGHSGRDGAGAEFLEVRTRIDQTASLKSIQLDLETLGISDSSFGEFSVDSNGVIYIKQDGVSFAIGQMAIAKFSNNQGLDPVGNNLFARTSDSGNPVYSVDNARTASIQGRALELSEADLGESLVNLMVFQRAFEANSKSITTADQLLTTLINLKN